MILDLLYLRYLKDCYLDFLYCNYLKKKRNKDDLPSIDDFNFIKNISGTIYPRPINGWKDCETLEDFISASSAVCLEQIYVYRGDNWYVVASDHYPRARLIDFAAVDGKCSNSWSVIVFLKKCFSNKEIEFYSRETTSYPLLLALEKRKRIKILSDRCIALNEEFFHDVIIKTIDPPKHKKKAK